MQPTLQAYPSPQALPVLEPLSRATGQTLKPLPFQPNDHLEVDLNADGTKFVVCAQAYTLAPDNRDDVRCSTCGGKRIHWSHNVEQGGHEFKPFQIVEIGGRFLVRDPRGASRNSAVNWARRVPERKEAGYGRYVMATTDFTALVIQSMWPAEKLIFLTEEAQIVYEVLIRRFELQAKRARIAADFKINKTEPTLPEDYIVHPDLPLADYQNAGMLMALDQEACGLIMEQGTGKTPIVVTRVNLEASRKEKGIYRVLVICPRQVRLNWSKEFERFSTVPGKVSIAKGSAVTRQRKLIDGIRPEDDAEFGVSIIALDSVKSLWDVIKIIPWDLVVIDESHYIKNPSARRSQWARKLSIRPNVAQRMILTGTPIANSPFDLWSQFEFLGEGLSGFSTFEGFKRFHGKFAIGQEKDGGQVKKLVALQNIPLMQERLARLCFTITKEEAGLQLPDKVRDLFEVRMTTKQGKAYRQLANELIIELEGMLEGDDKIAVDHILTKLLRLAQITSGHVKAPTVTDPNSGVSVAGRTFQIDETNPKVEAVVEMLTDPSRDPNGKTLIWCCFVEDMRIISEELAARGINHVGYHKTINKDYRVSGADLAEEMFNLDPECRVFIGNPASGGIGLNFLGYDREDPDKLDTFCDHIIYFSCNWSMTERAQSEDRAHRRGCRMPVRITDLLVPGTIDQEIRERVTMKRETALAIQDLKAVLTGLLDKYEVE